MKWKDFLFWENGALAIAGEEQDAINSAQGNVKDSEVIS